MSIQKHIFAPIDKLVVFKSGAYKETLTELNRGEWMGVVREVEEGVEVLTTAGKGWIKKQIAAFKTAQNITVAYVNGELRYSEMT